MIDSGLPVVVIDEQLTGTPAVDTVLVDDYAGAYQATGYLLSLGHRGVALLTGPPLLRSVRERTPRMAGRAGPSGRRGRFPTTAERHLQRRVRRGGAVPPARGGAAADRGLSPRATSSRSGSWERPGASASTCRGTCRSWGLTTFLGGHRRSASDHRCTRPSTPWRPWRSACSHRSARRLRPRAAYRCHQRLAGDGRESTSAPIGAV
ncbi:hypothetical protein ACRAWF_22940 [Streptomyces sp. L7]